jgi:hypothetical protein
MLDALCSTWFGTQSLYVHMINLIPVTSVTGELFDTEYVEKEYPRVIEPLAEVDMAWRGYVTADHAIINPNAAWLEALNLVSPTLDTALSKSQVLYWISTRKGFNASVAQTDSDGSPNSNNDRGGGGGDSGSAACQSIPRCSSTGLFGNCCPTDAGVFLDCCTARR